MTQTQPHEDVPPKRRAPLWQRLLLAAGSVLTTALLLEGATRLLVPPPAPVALQEGVYVTPLPLVTGRDTVAIVRGQPLPEAKRPGEIRIEAVKEGWDGAELTPAKLVVSTKAKKQGIGNRE